MCKAHIILYHSTLGLRVAKKKRRRCGCIIGSVPGGRSGLPSRREGERDNGIERDRECV